MEKHKSVANGLVFILMVVLAVEGYKRSKYIDSYMELYFCAMTVVIVSIKSGRKAYSLLSILSC